MHNTRTIAGAATLLLGASLAFGQAKDGKGKGAPAPMSFFVTSVGSGKGADLGGLAGADQHCQMLAAAAGTRKQHVARVSEHARRGGNQRTRSNRERSVG